MLAPALLDADGAAVVIHAEPPTTTAPIRAAISGARIACGVLAAPSRSATIRLRPAARARSTLVASSSAMPAAAEPEADQGQRHIK